MFDSYINMEVVIPRGNDGELYHATVKQRAIDDDGKLLGVETFNPITDTRIYEVDYLAGTVENIAANVISENLLSQVYQEGHRQILNDEIINHSKTPEAVNNKDDFN